ncbi:MAG: sigma factor [Pseudomonadota bacterium]
MQESAARHPRVWRYCLVMSGRRDAASDLARAACMRAIEKLHIFQAGTRLDRWLMTIAHRVWLNDRRSAGIRGAGRFVDLDAVDLWSQDSGSHRRQGGRPRIGSRFGLSSAAVGQGGVGSMAQGSWHRCCPNHSKRSYGGVHLGAAGCSVPWPQRRSRLIACASRSAITLVVPTGRGSLEAP